MKVAALACLMLFAGSGSIALADSPAERIKERFVDAIGKDWKEGVEICEMRSRENRRELFAGELELPPQAIQALKEQAFVVREPFVETSYQLLILDMVLAPNADFAAPQQPRLPSKVARTVLRQDRRVLVVSSESAAKPGVSKFLDALASAPSEEIWSSSSVRADSASERIKVRFVEAMSKDWQEGIEVCEVRARLTAARRDQLRWRMMLEPKTINRFEQTDFTVRKASSEPRYRLSVFDLDVAASADFAPLQQQGTLRSKVYARAVVLRQDPRHVLVVFSETSLGNSEISKVSKFLSELPSIPREEIWPPAK